MIRVLALVMALFLPVAALAAGEDDANLNRRARISLLLDSSVPAPEGLRRAIATGQCIQAMVTVDAAALLDPDSVTAEWNGAHVPRFVYYKQPDFAMVFVLPNHDAMAAPGGELTMTARLVGEDAIAAGWRLPVTLDNDDLTSAALSNAGRSGGSNIIAHADGRPAAGAWFFGQRRADLVTQADESGLVVLDAPSRNTPGPHYAWAEDTWTAAFDSVKEPNVTLVPRKGNERKGAITVVDAAGADVAPLVVLVDNNHYVASTTNRLELTLRSDIDTELIILAPGRQPLRHVMELDDVTARVTLP